MFSRGAPAMGAFLGSAIRCFSFVDLTTFRWVGISGLATEPAGRGPISSHRADNLSRGPSAHSAQHWGDRPIFRKRRQYLPGHADRRAKARVPFEFAARPYRAFFAPHTGPPVPTGPSRPVAGPWLLVLQA